MERSGDDGTLGGLGELAVLDRITRHLPAARGALLGPGDDAAVVAAPDGRFVTTTDLMVHGPDFRLAWSSGHDLGWKIAAANLADVAAMGAVPSGLLVGLAAPSSTPVALLEAIADGLRDACEALAPGCGVVGGDLSASASLTLAVTAFGDLEGRAPVRRDGASTGQTVAVAGPLGRAALGLRLLFSEGVDGSGAPDAGLASQLRARHPRWVGAQLAPEPPIAAGRAAALAGATAMLDLSDGLALDARRIIRASGVGIDLEAAAVRALAPGIADGLELALAGGEDHSLLAVLPDGAELPEGFARIGRTVPGDALTVDGAPVDLSGWDPYAAWDGAAG